MGHGRRVRSMETNKVIYMNYLFIICWNYVLHRLIARSKWPPRVNWTLPQKLTMMWPFGKGLADASFRLRMNFHDNLVKVLGIVESKSLSNSHRRNKFIWTPRLQICGGWLGPNPTSLSGEKDKFLFLFRTRSPSTFIFFFYEAPPPSAMKTLALFILSLFLILSYMECIQRI